MTRMLPHHLLLLLLSTLSVTVASAQGGLSFGISLNPLDLVSSANVTVPIFEHGEAQHAARADVSYAFHGLPAVSATYLLRDADAGQVRTYFGAGAGIGFLTVPDLAPVASLHALAGASVRIVDGLGVVAELMVGGNALATNMRFALGLDYTLGGN